MDYNSQNRLSVEDTITENNITDNKNKKGGVFSFIISLCVAILMALMLRLFVFELVKVSGESMEPTLHSNEYVFMEKVSYLLHEPSRGDIIICSYPYRTEAFVKRVIGIEGDVLEINDGVLYINDTASYDFFSEYMHEDFAPITIPPDCVFVMGDNRNYSLDSTDTEVGPLSYDMILGKAMVVIWPLNAIHGL